MTGDAAREPLKPAERGENIFPVIGERKRLQVRTDALNFFPDRPGAGIDHHDPARRRRWMQHREVELRAVEREHHVEGVGIFARATAGPRYGRSSSIWSGRDRRSRTRRSCFPADYSSCTGICRRAKTRSRVPVKNLVERDFPVVVVDLLHRILVRRILVELDERRRREILFGIENDDAAAQADHSRRPAPARMPMVPSAPVRP